jgi:hypothetical protein
MVIFLLALHIIGGGHELTMNWKKESPEQCPRLAPKKLRGRYVGLLVNTLGPGENNCYRQTYLMSRFTYACAWPSNMGSHRCLQLK